MRIRVILWWTDKILHECHHSLCCNQMSTYDGIDMDCCQVYFQMCYRQKNDQKLKIHQKSHNIRFFFSGMSIYDGLMEMTWTLLNIRINSLDSNFGSSSVQTFIFSDVQIFWKRYVIFLVLRRQITWSEIFKFFSEKYISILEVSSRITWYCKKTDKSRNETRVHSLECLHEKYIKIQSK